MSEKPTSAEDPATSVIVHRVGFVGGLFALGLTIVLPAPDGMAPEAWGTAGVAMLLAFWWATEALPIAATSLVPIVVFPILGVTPIGETTAPYANPLIFLFLGGFMIALAMQRWNLHRRIALAIVSSVGPKPERLVLGFMCATALLSMWISNTATTMMMLPIAASVAAVLLAEAKSGVAGHDHRNFAVALMLGVAYAASIGGVGTLIGTPTNATMAAILSAEPFNIQLGFTEWMLVGLPFVAIMLPLTWLVLTRAVYAFDLGPSQEAADHVMAARRELGPISTPERRVAAVAGLVGALWVLRGLAKELAPDIYVQAMAGWSDAGIAIFGTVLLFLIPAGRNRTGPLMLWETTRGLPWGLILLFGGGLSLANAMEASGLAVYLSTHLSVLGVLPLILLVGAIVAVIVFLTELTSNAATVAAFVPVIAALAVGIGIDPLVLAAPASIAASCAFMLPVATPPNAVVFGSGYITIPQMVRAGVWLNLVSIVVVTLVGALLVPLVFG